MWFGLFECKHRHISKVKEDGKQYCLSCNKVIIPECVHFWEKVSENNILFCGKKIGITTTLQCKHCGDMKTHEMKA
jgi:hypothetical protein